MSWTLVIDYWVSIREGGTLRLPYPTIGWIRNVGEVGRRGGPLCRLIRVSYNTLEVDISYSMVNI
jgi:hypothetical protein